MVNHKDDWRQLPRMGKRKRQVLTILVGAYERDKASARRFKDRDEADQYRKDEHPEMFADLEESHREPHWGWRPREYIFRKAATEELPPHPWPGLPISSLPRMVLEVAPQALRDEYDRKAVAAAKARVEGTDMEAWGKWLDLKIFEDESIAHLKNSEGFKARWGALRGSLYWAVKALEKEGLAESRVRKFNKVRYFRITPAGRDAISDL